MKNRFDTLYKKILQHRRVAIFLMIVIFVLLECATYIYDQHDSIVVNVYKRFTLTRTLEQSQEFYDTYDTPLQTDEFIALMWLWPERAAVAQRAFHSDPFYRTYADELRNDHFEIVRRIDTMDMLTDFEETYGTSAYVYDLSGLTEEIMTDPTDDVVLKALYCDTFGYDQFDYQLLYNERDHRGGYGDTHFLLSVLFLEQLGCVSKEDIATDKQSVIDDIIFAQQTDHQFSDLFAERVVFLYWAGEGEQITLSQMKLIANNIQSDGGWKDVGAHKSNPHASGLAALAISYFIAGDDHQNVLIQ
jgi:hypothetical protein